MTFTHSTLKFMLLFGVKYNIRIHFWIVFSIDLLAYLWNNKLERDRIQIDKIPKNHFRFNNFSSKNMMHHLTKLSAFLDVSFSAQTENLYCYKISKTLTYHCFSVQTITKISIMIYQILLQFFTYCHKKRRSKSSNICKSW